LKCAAGVLQASGVRGEDAASDNIVKESLAKQKGVIKCQVVIERVLVEKAHKQDEV
jgi:hypothetical protein